MSSPAIKNTFGYHQECMSHFYFLHTSPITKALRILDNNNFVLSQQGSVEKNSFPDIDKAVDLLYYKTL